jgi:gas vesicle protein
MDFNKLEKLGDELREAGHKRRQLVEQIYDEVKQGDPQASQELYQELKDVSDQAINIIERQKEIVDNELEKM